MPIPGSSALTVYSSFDSLTFSAGNFSPVATAGNSGNTGCMSSLLRAFISSSARVSDGKPGAANSDDGKNGVSDPGVRRAILVVGMDLPSLRVLYRHRKMCLDDVEICREELVAMYV